MEEIYLRLKFNKRTNNRQNKENSWLVTLLENSMIKVLTTIIPKANPDFEKEIDNVHEWLIEFNKDTEVPQREIGVDNNGRMIMIMPFRKNYGYWTDNDLNLAD
jgi:hypothetical protein